MSSLSDVDDPIAIHPHVARLVLLVAIGVGIAGRIEPDPAPSLAVVGRREQPFDFLGDKPRRGRATSRSLRTRRSPRASAASRSDRATTAATTSRGSACGDGCSLACSKRASTKASIGLRTQLASSTCGTSGRSGGTNAQCFLYSAPCATHRLRMSICSGVSVLPESTGGIRNSSSSAVIRAIKFALVEVAGDDHVARAHRVVRALPNVEPQIGLPALRIGPVAVEAFVGENRPHVAREIDRASLRPRMPLRANASHRPSPPPRGNESCGNG